MKRMACLLMCVMLGASPSIQGQSDSVAAGDWITFNRTLAGSRFSPLSDIQPGERRASPASLHLHASRGSRAGNRSIGD
jgi:hypothetical protein